MEMENEFTKLNFTESAVMIALSKYNINQTLHQFIHDTLIGMVEVPRYLVHNRMIYVVVVSSGNSPIEMIRRAEKKGAIIIDPALQIILSNDFKVSDSVVSVIAIVSGSIFADRGRTTKLARNMGKKKGLHNCSEESVLLLREKLHNKDLVDLGLGRIVVFHKTLKDLSGKKRLLNVSINGDYESITARLDNQDNPWSADTGFAFEYIKIST